jgi:hypothetical protein
MKRWIHTTLRLLLVFLPVVLALPQARAQGDTVCVGQTSIWSVEPVEGVEYYWELYNDVEGINLAVVPGNCPPTEAYFMGGVNTGDSVEVMCLAAGTYFIKVTATDSCTNNIKVGMIIVEECYSTAIFLEPEPICSDDKAMMTIEITGGAGPWEVTFTNGADTWSLYVTVSPYTFPLVPTPTLPGSYQYWITSVTNAAGIINTEPSDPVTLIVKPKPVTSPIYRY